MTIRTNYSKHCLHCFAIGANPLTLRQFVALSASIAFGG